MFRYFQYKFMFAAFVVAISMMFQQIEIDSTQKNRIAEKGVVLSKSRKEVYEFISNLENLPLWFPNIKEVYSLDSKSEPSVGKKYRQISTWLFGLGETQTQLTISSVQPLFSIEFYSDNLLKEINHFELSSLEVNRTRLEWKIHSMRKTLLFKYTLGYCYQFYYGQLVREALFSLQFLIKK